MIEHGLMNRLLAFCALALLCAGTVGAQTAAPAASAATAAVPPSPPRLEFVYEARVKLGELKMMGRYADGHERGVLQLLGGVFEGPGLRGTILPSNKDWPVYYGNGVRSTDVNYVFVTEDGAHLFVTATGFRYDPSRMSGSLLAAEQVQPTPNLLRVTVQIQAPQDTRYAWLNHNVFVGVAGQSVPGPDRTAVLRVYRLL
jgi:hypothetical protein